MPLSASFIWTIVILNVYVYVVRRKLTRLYLNALTYNLFNHKPPKHLMEFKGLMSQLKLAYAPITAYEFAKLKNDRDIEKALSKAGLYAIAQRPVITFENITVDESEFQLHFEMHQKDNKNILKCTLPLTQYAFGLSDMDIITIALNHLDKSIVNQEDDYPLRNIHNFSLGKKIDNKFKNRSEFIIWFSPEKLLQNWWTKGVDCKIEGDFRSFLEYKIHYVGKATKQNIFKRLTGHSTFQDILSLETPVTPKQLPANEITILCFEFYDNLQIQSFGDNSGLRDMIDAVSGKNYPDAEKVFLDAEKALIKAMKPHYNKELFNSYPISKDGLSQDNYNLITYTFTDPISLIYPNGVIKGGLSWIGGNAIVINNNKEFHLVESLLSKGN